MERWKHISSGAIGVVAIVLGLAGMAARTTQMCGQTLHEEVRSLSAPDPQAVANLASAWQIAAATAVE